MKTKYTDKIHFFINEDLPEDAFMYWVEKQTLIDQPDIMREFKNILKVGFANKGIYDFDFEFIEDKENKVENNTKIEEDLILLHKKREREKEKKEKTEKQINKQLEEQMFQNIVNNMLDKIKN